MQVGAHRRAVQHLAGHQLGGQLLQERPQIDALQVGALVERAVDQGEGGDPLVIMIGVKWTKDGWCSGQFTVQATETPTEVHVGHVTSREHSKGMCAGLGTADNTAWAYVQLAAPLGDRVVIRDSDGAPLPVR